MRAVFWILPLLLLAPFAVPADEAPAHRLNASQWAMPRTGQRVLQLSPVAAAVRELQSAPADSRLHVRYAGGDRGTLWARDLESWLIALGIGSDRIELRPGGTDVDTLELTVVGGRPDRGKD